MAHSQTLCGEEGGCFTGLINSVVIDVYWNIWSLLILKYDEWTYCTLVM